MPAIFDYQWSVQESEIDMLGHVNNVEYIRWMQNAAFAHSKAQGWSSRRYSELGAGWVARSHRIEYLSPAMPGDTIIVRTWVSTFEKIRSLRKFRILRQLDQTLLAEAETMWVFINFQRQQPCRVPDEVRSAFELVPSEAEQDALAKLVGEKK